MASSSSFSIPTTPHLTTIGPTTIRLTAGPVAIGPTVISVPGKYQPPIDWEKRFIYAVTGFGVFIIVVAWAVWLFKGEDFRNKCKNWWGNKWQNWKNKCQNWWNGRQGNQGPEPQPDGGQSDGVQQHEIELDSLSGSPRSENVECSSIAESQRQEGFKASSVAVSVREFS